MAKRRALITGITGQDGSYLSQFLLDEGYEVFGLVRRHATSPYINIEQILDRINLVTGDMSDYLSLMHAVERVQPDEVYNLAAQSFVASSWELPEMTSDVTGLGALRMLEVVRRVCPQARFYQASSSEMFGLTAAPQGETSPFHPCSPYGVAKLFAHWATVNYRESFGMFACSGILFNHESPRRGQEFVTRKIARGVAEIHLGLTDHLALGNLQARRDWGFSGDYVEAMWRMLQEERAEDYVIGTGVTRSVGDFAAAAFAHVGLDWRRYVVQEEQFCRPSEVPELCANAEKARQHLRWEPSTTFSELVAMMVEQELRLAADTRCLDRPI